MATVMAGILLLGRPRDFERALGMLAEAKFLRPFTSTIFRLLKLWSKSQIYRVFSKNVLNSSFKDAS